MGVLSEVVPNSPRMPRHGTSHGSVVPIGSDGSVRSPSALTGRATVSTKTGLQRAPSGILSSMSASSHPPPEVTGYVEETVSAVAGICPGRLVAAYLHGSAALGGWTPGRSDVDLLLVTGNLGRADLDAVAEALVASNERCPGSGLECSVVTVFQASRPRAPWPFLLHVQTAADQMGVTVVRGTELAGDSDLLMHYVTCRSAGWVVHGPEPAELVGAVARSTVLGYLADELEWGLDRESQAYSVLNACRALVYLHDEQVVSKIAGGVTALERGIGPPAAVRRALYEQQGGDRGRSLAAGTIAFVGAAADTLRSAAAESAANSGR